MDTPQSDLNETLITLTSDIVAAHVSNNSVSVADLAAVISNVYTALAALGQSAPVAEAPPEPAVSIRSSIKPDHIVCLEDGKKFKVMKPEEVSPLVIFCAWLRISSKFFGGADRPALANIGLL